MVGATPQENPAMRAPSVKERRYDRQLRLWAASGQAALECAHVLLINSGSGTVGIETLKNLVLPGIGSFTIADDAIVTDSDLGLNFFLDESCRDKSRARCCAQLLMELNPDVTGHYYPEPNCRLDIKALLDSSDLFTMIFYVLPLPVNQVDVIKAYARNHRVPVIAIHSVGFYSYFSIYMPEIFPVVETHPENTAKTDLRLLNPWPELTTFANDMTKDIESLSDFEHGHLPMVVILLHYLSVWRSTHGGAYPITYTDKVAFRSLIANAARRDIPEGGEENFEEAAAAVMKVITPHIVPDALQQVFELCDKIKSQPTHQPKFWTVARAVKQFFCIHDQLPLSGVLPDMKAQSKVYIQLRNLYKEKARKDALEVLATVRNIDGGEDVTQTDVELFCINARFVKLIQANDTEKGTADVQWTVDVELARDKAMALATLDAPKSLILIYLALAATAHTATATAEKLASSIVQRAPALEGNEKVVQVAEEISRAKGGELHNISAITGGMVAQEAIKIITNQYTPMENTCVFDGIESRCQVFRL